MTDPAVQHIIDAYDHVRKMAEAVGQKEQQRAYEHLKEEFLEKHGHIAALEDTPTQDWKDWPSADPPVATITQERLDTLGAGFILFLKHLDATSGRKIGFYRNQDTLMIGISDMSQAELNMTVRSFEDIRGIETDVGRDEVRELKKRADGLSTQFETLKEEYTTLLLNLRDHLKYALLVNVDGDTDWMDGTKLLVEGIEQIMAEREEKK